MKLYVLCLVAACTGGSSGSGDDLLPLRGDLPSDPTITAVVASCGGSVSSVTVRIGATDPGGPPNLASCRASINGAQASASWLPGLCAPVITSACHAGGAAVVDVTVTNRTGGSTTASVTVPVGP